MAGIDSPNTTPVPPSTTTLRVTFAYRDRDVRLVASRRVAMIAPPTVTPAPAQGQSGYWFELRGAAGELLFHRVLNAPIRVDVEVFSDDANQTMKRVPLSAPQGQFEVLVPDLPDATTFHFFGTPSGAVSESAPSRELFRADFDALRKLQADAPAPDPGTTSPGSDRK